MNRRTNVSNVYYLNLIFNMKDVVCISYLHNLFDSAKIVI